MFRCGLGNFPGCAEAQKAGSLINRLGRILRILSSLPGQVRESVNVDQLGPEDLGAPSGKERVQVVDADTVVEEVGEVTFRRDGGQLHDGDAGGLAIQHPRHLEHVLIAGLVVVRH